MLQSAVSTPVQETSNTEKLKIEVGKNYEILLPNGIESIMTWYQHEWWAKTFDGKPTGVSENVVFACLGKENGCPGCAKAAPTQKFISEVWLKNGDVLTPMVFYMPKSIYKGIANIYAANAGADIKSLPLVITNSGKGFDRYSVQVKLTPVDFSKIKKPEEQIDLEKSVRILTQFEAQMLMDKAFNEIELVDE